MNTENSQNNSGVDLVVRLHIPLDEALSIKFPPGNRIASELVCDRLKTNLIHDGITLTSAEWLLPLNCAYFTFRLGDSRQASIGLPILKQHLERFGLFQFAQIGWCDWANRRESVYEHPEAKLALPTEQEFEAEAKILANQNAAIQKRLRDLQRLKDELE